MLCWLLPLQLQNPSHSFWERVEEQGSLCHCCISLHIDISGPKTTREVNSCWILSSVSLLLLFWWSGSPGAKHTRILKAQLYLFPWFSVPLSLSRWALKLYSKYALFAFLFILHPTFNYTAFQSLCYRSLFSAFPIAIPNLSLGCFSAQHAICHTHAWIALPPKKGVKSIHVVIGLPWTKYQYQQPDSTTGWSLHNNLTDMQRDLGLMT